ncbi:aminotransferase class V-fold PLP-dependent enzyme [Streptomyces alanosinicus]|uniref:Cysteine desulfurase n=1 Tax=Streptomyces alanosinicus TaxID=68171 RepID=A0A918YC78_9ACTN|nr:aminotransferase class V-fold PLP-dependent enzyme [Streptomyces alanosinicus]GHD97718.1 cysteine desulfurase [Streptomyces alanosinicus]
MTTAMDLRADFPVLQRTVDAGPLVYLDNAATSLKPRSVIDAMARYYDSVSANIHRGKHILSEEASERYEQVRARIAARLGVPPRNIVFTANATDGINLVATGLALTDSDLVALPLDAHHSAQLPWRERCRTAWLAASEHATVDEEALRSVLDRSPEVVVLTACSNVTGHTADVDRLAALAREAGAWTVVDAAQLAAHGLPQVGESVDALAFSAHKMLGPTGIGVLYLSDRLIEALTPSRLGGGTVDWADEHEFRLRRAPYRFEPGTPNISGVYGLGAALEYLDAIGPAELAARDASLVDALLREAKARPYLTVLGGLSEQNRLPVLTVTLRGVPDPSAVARALSDSYGVMCRSGYFCAQPYFAAHRQSAGLRIAPYLYNTEGEIAHTFAALDELHPLLARGVR